MGATPLSSFSSWINWSMDCWISSGSPLWFGSMFSSSWDCRISESSLNFYSENTFFCLWTKYSILFSKIISLNRYLCPGRKFTWSKTRSMFCYSSNGLKSSSKPSFSICILYYCKLYYLSISSRLISWSSSDLILGFLAEPWNPFLLAIGMLDLTFFIFSWCFLKLYSICHLSPFFIIINKEWELLFAVIRRVEEGSLQVKWVSLWGQC